MKCCLESSEEYKTTSVQFGAVSVPLRLNDVEPRSSHQALFVVADLNVTRPKLGCPRACHFGEKVRWRFPFSRAELYLLQTLPVLSAEAKE